MSTKRRSPAGCFLKIVAALIALFIAAAFAYRIFEKELMRWAMVPSVEFREVANPAGADYAQAPMWIARPDIPGNPALWTPEGFAPADPGSRG